MGNSAAGKSIKNFFAEFDTFPAQPTLRANEEAKKSTLYTGIFSFLMFSGFVYIFIIGCISIVNY